MLTPTSEKPGRHKRRSSAMKPKSKRQRTEGNAEPAAETEPENNALKGDSDLCDQLMSRYSASTAPHHRHLLATAAAFRSILSAESRPLTPTGYFMAAMDNLSDSEALDSAAVAALSTLVSIATPLIPENEMGSDRATESVAVLVGAVFGREEGLGVSTLSGVVKCLGVLIGRFCDLEDWNSVKQGIETLLKLSVDKRPKLRRAAQDCLVEVLKSFRSSDTIKEASKLVLSLLKSHTPLAVALDESETGDVCNAEASLSAKHLELLHVLNLLKVTIPHLSEKISSKILSELVKLMASDCLPYTRNVFQIIEVFLTTSLDEVIGPHVEDIANSLAGYILSGEKNPVDTVFSAARLLKLDFDKLMARGSCSWMGTFPKILGSLAGFLSLEAGTASQATDIIKELIKCIDVKVLLTDKGRSFEIVREGSQEADMIRATCLVFENALNSSTGVPNEQILSLISVLFRRLGEFSFIFMEGFVVKLADLINHANPDSPETVYLQSCIGSAVVALGPEKILGLIPICFSASNLTCSNAWLVPILKDFIVGARLEFYVEHIVPLAKSLQRASRKVKKSVLREELQALSQGLLGLLSAFCHYPVDTHKMFESLASILIGFLQKEPSMHKSIAVALKALVSQNRSALGTGCNAVELTSNVDKDLVSDARITVSYSIKVANRNIKALASQSRDLLQTLIDVFIDSPPDKRLHLKEAIGCVASITKPSVTKKIFLLLLKKLKLVNTAGEFEEPASDSDELVNEEQNNLTNTEKTERSNIMDIASCLVEGANEDLIQLTYKFITYLLQQEPQMPGHREAYCTLSKILQHHGWFCSAQSVELIDLLVNLKTPVDITSIKNRFNCFHFLVVHTLEKLGPEEDNPRTFLILNEIILTLKDGKDEARRVASDTLIRISSQLRKSSQLGSDELYHKLVSMILGYLSGSSAHIKSGAVSALSVLVYNDADICLNMTDLVPSVLSLLQSKDLEVAKAALGFMKVVVSCLEAKDLQGLVSDILTEILPWSSVSRNHLRSKVTIILEILMRKCTSGAVQSVTPDKYKNFVKTILQNRHQKSDSQGSKVNDGDTARIEGSSAKRSENEAGVPEKRQRQGSSSAHRDRKRKWEGKNESQRGAGDGGGSNRDKRQREQPKRAFGGGKKGGFGQRQQRTGRNSSNGGGGGGGMRKGGFKRKAN